MGAIIFIDTFKTFAGILSIPVALEEDKAKNEGKTLFRHCVKFKGSAWLIYL